MMLSPRVDAIARAVHLGGAGRDDRLVLAVLLAPFLIIAMWLGAERSARQLISRAPAPIAAETSPRAPVAEAPKPMPVTAGAAIDPSSVTPAPAPESVAPALDLPALALLIEPTAETRLDVAPMPAAPAIPLPSLALLIERPSVVDAAPASQPQPEATQLPALALVIEPPAPVLSRLEPLIATPTPPLASLAPSVEPPALLPALERLVERTTEPPVCAAGDEVLRPPTGVARTASAPSDPAQFGIALAKAATAQIAGITIYNPKYLRIAYPMGDVPPLFGVCTDVIVRAYRTLGIDLQALIQETGLGRGDRNIDHRRVEILRNFLTRHGQTLPITDLAEDYQPGDIVTYYRPQNRSSTSHIAIVTDQLAPSGRLMIVHNRGWGPELEDALFVDKITGHYRFTGLSDAPKSDARSGKRRLARQSAP